jgi:hypothetical protein
LQQWQRRLHINSNNAITMRAMTPALTSNEGNNASLTTAKMPVHQQWQ